MTLWQREQRPNGSLETALRLLQHVGASLNQLPAVATVSEDDARAERAARQRVSWVGVQTTMTNDASPHAPNGAVARLVAVAANSQLAAGLQHAHQADGRRRFRTRRLREWCAGAQIGSIAATTVSIERIDHGFTEGIDARYVTWLAVAVAAGGRPADSTPTPIPGDPTTSSVEEAAQVRGAWSETTRRSATRLRRR